MTIRGALAIGAACLVLADGTAAQTRPPNPPGSLERYAAASFAATVAEYIHSLWHDVAVRTETEHLPAPWLRRRLDMLARWFPPGRGYRLYPLTP